MAQLLLLAFGIALGLLGGATALDFVSLRVIAHSLDVPVLSGAVIGLREGMGSSMAHFLEPAGGLLGGGLTVWCLVRRYRLEVAVVARGRGREVRTVLLAARASLATLV